MCLDVSFYLIYVYIYIYIYAFSKRECICNTGGSPLDTESLNIALKSWIAKYVPTVPCVQEASISIAAFTQFLATTFDVVLDIEETEGGVGGEVGCSA